MHASLTALLLLLPPHADPPAGRVVRAADAPTHVIAGGKGRATLLLNAATATPEAALTLLVLSAGAAVPEHVHEGSAEILYVESGTVEMTLGGRTVAAGPGDAIHIPAGLKHSARVTSRDAPLRAVQVYVGPGPEQRFSSGERVPTVAR